MHITQLMPLPLTVSCFSKIQIGFSFLAPAHPDSPGQRAVKWMCVCLSAFIMPPKQDINEKLQGSVATCLRCGGVVNNQIKKGVLLSL